MDHRCARIPTELNILFFFYCPSSLRKNWRFPNRESINGVNWFNNYYCLQIQIRHRSRSSPVTIYVCYEWLFSDTLLVSTIIFLSSINFFLWFSPFGKQYHHLDGQCQLLVLMVAFCILQIVKCANVSF